MKEMFYRDHLIAAHAVPVGASAGVRYGYQGEILPAGQRAQAAAGLPSSYASDIETAFENPASAIEACLLAGRQLIDSRLDGAENPAASADPTHPPGFAERHQRSTI